MRRGRKFGPMLLVAVVTMALAGGVAYGVLAMADTGKGGMPRDVAAPPRAATPTRPTSAPVAKPPQTPAATPTPPPTATPTAPPTEAPTPTAPPTEAPTEAPTPTEAPSQQAEPEPVLQPGDRGVRVRELQARLIQLSWLSAPTTGRFDDTTRAAVTGFQSKRGFDATGEVDERSWRRLVQMSRAPTGDEMFNRVGPALFGPGDAGRQIREIQSRLRQIGWFHGNVSDTYADLTTAAVAGFQAKREVPQTGRVDQRTLDLLEAMTHEPTADELANRPDAPAAEPVARAALDRRCTTGRSLCIDKTTSQLRWVVDGTVRISLDVRFGAEYSPTREGLFHVGWKDRDHVSHLYGSAMPLSMFFSGGQAVHYSSDFAARGYSGASHGCVNVRDYDGLASLFDQVRLGDKVVVYWS